MTTKQIIRESVIFTVAVAVFLTIAFYFMPVENRVTASVILFLASGLIIATIQSFKD